MQPRLPRHFNWKCTDSCAIAAAAVERRERTAEEKEEEEKKGEMETERWRFNRLPRMHLVFPPPSTQGFVPF